MPEETLNSASYRGARKQGAVMSASHDDSYAKPVTAMTLAEINKKNEALHHNVGVAETQAAAPELAGTRVSRSVPVYTGAGIGDEGDSTPEERQNRKVENQIRKYGKGARLIQHTQKVAARATRRFGLNEDEVQPTQSDPPDDRSDNLLGETAVAGDTGDDLAKGTESMSPEGQADAEHQPHPGATPLTNYGAKAQSEREAHLKTPEGNAERLKRNEERIAKKTGREPWSIHQ